jgi:hypothetical protein
MNKTFSNNASDTVAAFTWSPMILKDECQ